MDSNLGEEHWRSTLPKIEVMPWNASLSIGAGVDQYGKAKATALLPFTLNKVEKRWIEEARIVSHVDEVANLRLLCHPTERHTFALFSCHFDAAAEHAPWLEHILVSMSSFTLVIRSHCVYDTSLCLPRVDTKRANTLNTASSAAKFRRFSSTLFKNHGIYFVAGERHISSFVALFQFECRDLESRRRCESAARTLAASVRFDGTNNLSALGPEEVTCLFSNLKDVMVFEDGGSGLARPSGRLMRRETYDILSGDITRSILRHLDTFKKTQLAVVAKPCIPRFVLLHRYSEEVPSNVLEDTWVTSGRKFACLSRLIFDSMIYLQGLPLRETHGIQGLSQQVRSFNRLLSTHQKYELFDNLDLMDKYFGIGRKLLQQVCVIHAQYWLSLKSRWESIQYPYRFEGCSVTIGLASEHALPGATVGPVQAGELVKRRPRWLKLVRTQTTTLCLPSMIDGSHVVGWRIRCLNGRIASDCVQVYHEGAVGEELRVDIEAGALWWRGFEITPFIVDDESLKRFTQPNHYRPVQV